jgi:hypothetical protein
MNEEGRTGNARERGPGGNELMDGEDGGNHGSKRRGATWNGSGMRSQPLSRHQEVVNPMGAPKV